MAHMPWFTCQLAISRHSAPKAKGLWEEREQTTHRSSHCCRVWAVSSLAGLTPPGHLSWGGLGACSLSPFPAPRRVWHWLECHSPTASHTPGNAHGITSWAAHQRGALQAIKSEPNPRWPQPQLAALGAAAPSEGGRSCLLYIVTAGAKLLHPSHLLAAVQLINWSQEFLSGLEQHPEASDHSYCQSCKHCSRCKQHLLSPAFPASCVRILWMQTYVSLLTAIPLETRWIIILLTSILHLNNTTRQ